MRKLLLTILLLFSFAFLGKSQYLADSCLYYPNMWEERYATYKNKYTIDIENINDSTLVIIESHKKVKLKSVFLLESLIDVKIDDDGCQFAFFTAKEIRLDVPEFITFVRKGGKIIGITISDGENLTIWYLRKKEEDSQ